jgi:hypothetical protein
MHKNIFFVLLVSRLHYNLGSKKNFMASHKGKSSGINKSAPGTGTPSDFKASDVKKDKRLTKKYTKDDNEIADNVKLKHPNRNVDKEDATNAGGYKN